MASFESPLAPEDRYVLRRRVGEGAHGVVYEAFDSQRCCRVALKMLRRDDPANLARFKREFRSLADVTHRHLLALYDLVASDAQSFFTMELVEGTTFIDAVRAGGDLPALLAQLAEGVAALHAGGKLHRDLKPSNVLVTHREARVVIVDFGLASELGPGVADDAAVAGTWGYIAPEQLCGGTPSPAADWFSVGAILHEALVGHPPLNGRAAASIVAGAASAADGLEALCTALLTPNPEARGDGTHIFAHLRRSRKSPPVMVGRPSDENLIFCGRQAELATLMQVAARALAGQVAVAVLKGRSGVGKTALAKRLLTELQATHTVLIGRCRERELVPYKGFEEIVDGVAAHPETPVAIGALSGEDRAALTRIFPGLRGLLGAEASEERDPRELRRRAFAALRQLLTRLAEDRPLAVCIDDLQWSDSDTTALVEAVFRAPAAPRAVIVVTHRDDDDSPALAAALKALTAIDSSALHIEVATLSRDDALAVARSLTKDEVKAADIAGESGGHPLFIQQLAQDGARPQAPNLRGLIEARITELPAPAVALLEALALAARPLFENVAHEAAGLGDVSPAALLYAVNARLVVTRTAARGKMLEVAHDRVREIVAHRLAPDRARQQHSALARALHRAGAEPEILVEHYLGAGERERAADESVAAADRACAALAFDREASHLERALDLPVPRGERWRLAKRRAIALANAGRGASAADGFEHASALLAAEGGATNEVLTLARLAGEHGLRSGHIERGSAQLRRVLAQIKVSVPATRVAALLVTLLRRLGFILRGLKFFPRSQQDIDPVQTERLDALWAITTSLVMVDVVMADAIGVQHLLEALRVGSVSHVVRGMGYQAGLEAFINNEFFARRSAKMLAKATALAATTGLAYDRAWVAAGAGASAWAFADYPRAVAALDEARAIFVGECRGVGWELALIDSFCLPSIASQGYLGELGRRVAERLARAEANGDLFSLSVLNLGQQNLVHLASDDPARARAAAEKGIAALPKRYVTHHYHFLLAMAQADLYEQNGLQALARIERDWKQLQTLHLMSGRNLKSEIHHLRARAAIVAIKQRADDRGRLLRIVEYSVRQMARDKVPKAVPLVACTGAALAALVNDHARAHDLLRRSVDAFERCHKLLYAASARYHLGDVEGARWMQAQGIRNPAAMAAMLVPGFC